MHKFYQSKIFKITNNYALHIFLLYFFILLISTLFLSLPMVQHQLSELSWKKQIFLTFFTCVSSLTNTGFSVWDLSNKYNFWGQFIILILIKMGGIGIISLKIFFFSFFWNITLKTQMLFQEEKGENNWKKIIPVIKIGTIIILITETFGALLLFINFWFFSTIIQGSMLKIIWISIFQSVSATNNAGLNNFPGNSLLIIQKDYLTQWILITCWIIGGIGFPVFYDLFNKLKAKWNKQEYRFQLFTKLTLSTYFALLFASLIIIFVIEMVALIRQGRALNVQQSMIILFNTLSARSAGFNTVNMDQFNILSQVIHLILMFVGGSPFSSGGGIRTIAFGIICLSLTRFNHSHLIIFKKQINFNFVIRAFKIFTWAIFILISSSILIQLEALCNGEQENNFFTTFYACVSAFGTAGLLLSDINESSRIFQLIILMALMLIGQISILNTILLFGNQKKTYIINYPEERIIL